MYPSSTVSRFIGLVLPARASLRAALAMIQMAAAMLRQVFPDLVVSRLHILFAQLTAYREQRRATDENTGGMMRGVAEGLTDTEIAQVADYIQGLH